MTDAKADAYMWSQTVRGPGGQPVGATRHFTDGVPPGNAENPQPLFTADTLSQARAEGRREGQIAERERMQRKEMRRAVTWLHGFAARMNDPHAKQVINLAADEYGRETATAIRALAQKEGGK